MKKIIIVVSLIAVVALNAPVYANTHIPEHVSTGAAVLDAVVVRPLCLLGAGVTTAIYVVVAIPTYMMGYADLMAEYLVVKPWGYVSERPLGEF